MKGFLGDTSGTRFALREVMRALALPVAVLPALTGACYMDDHDLEEPGPPVVSSGVYHHYVQSSWTLPTSSEEARSFGFDFDKDGRIDNQAGGVIAALSGIGLDVQTASDVAITDGDVVILHTVRADALVSDPSVSWRVLSGAPSTPPRWDGTDVFRVSGEDGSFVGPIVGENARMDWGVVNLPLPFFPDQSPVILPLAHARIAADISESSCDGRIGGVMLAADIQPTLERFVRQAITHIERNPDNEFARLARDVFDNNDDGVITVEEMAGSSIAQSLFRADVNLDGRNGPDGLSFGLAFSCVDAQFWAPGEI